MKYEILPYERIRNLRIDRDLTQEDIAQTLGIKQNTYSQYETGVLRYPVDVFVKLALFYNTSMDYLAGITDNPAAYKRNGCPKTAAHMPFNADY